MVDHDSQVKKIVPSDQIKARFQEWWTFDDMHEILRNEKICAPAFLLNILAFQKTGELKGMSSTELARLVFEQTGEKFFFEKDKSKRFAFMTHVFRGAAKNDPAIQNDIRGIIEKYFFTRMIDGWNKRREKLNTNTQEYQKIKTAIREKREELNEGIPYFNDEYFEQWLRGILTGGRATSSKFLLEICDVLGLPDACAQKAPKTEERKTEEVEPVGTINPLYDFQRDIERKINRMLSEYDPVTSRAMVALPTGSGKTRLVVESIINWINQGKPGQQNKKFILWMVDRKELCQQAYDTIKSQFLATGKPDTTLKLHVFWGTKSKNLTTTLEKEKAEDKDYESFSESVNTDQDTTTSIIVASVGSLGSIYSRHVKRKEKDNALRNLGKELALVVIDEAHHAIGESYSHVLQGLGFNFQMTTEPHPDHVRLLGLTATPFRNEEDLSKETLTLQNRFGGKDRFLWPDLDSSSLTNHKNHPNPIIELQKFATIGNPVKVSGERSFDQDGKIIDYYWQVKFKPPLLSARSGNHHKYDTGNNHYKFDGDETENLEKWKGRREPFCPLKGNEEEKSKWFSEEVFDEPGSYQILLWVKDDDGYVSQHEAMRTITVREAPKKDEIDNQKKMKYILKKLTEQKVMAVAKRWIVEHDFKDFLNTQSRDYNSGLSSEVRMWIRTNDIFVSNEVTGTDGITRTLKTDKLKPEIEELMAEDAKFNMKIIKVIKKLLAGTGKKNKTEIKKESILLFVSRVNHAKLLSSLIRSSMPETKCQYIFAGTHTDERCRYISEFRAKKIKVLCNVDILTAGFDGPEVDAIVIARDTGSYVLYTQMVGRGLRGPKNGGTDECRVVDFNNKLRERIAGQTEEQKEAAWQVHEELYAEDETLNDYDLGIKKLEDLDWPSDSFYKNAYDYWLKKGYMTDYEIKQFNKLFTDEPEYQTWKPELWIYLQKKHDELKNVGKSLDGIYDDDAIQIDDDVSQSNKLSYSELENFICNEMKMQANYQPVMIKFLLSRTNYTASRTYIAKELQSANSSSQKNYEEVPVFDVLKSHNVVTEVNGFYTLNVEKLNDSLEFLINNLLDIKIVEANAKNLKDAVKEYTCKECGFMTKNMNSFILHEKETGHLVGDQDD